MSKRVLALALVLGILATSNAFASRSRTTVLGTGDAGLFLDAGSFFYDDARNIFYNPSYVNDFKNWGIIEKSNYVSGGPLVATPSTPQLGTTAEGGFVTSVGSFNLGVYLNRLSSIANLVGNMGTAMSGAQRPIEVFFGGDMGNMKWGVSADYSMANAANQTDTNLIFRAGVEVADFEPFGWVTAIGHDNTDTGGATTDFKTYGVGLRYKMGEWIPYAGWRQDQAPAGGDPSAKSTTWLAGLGRTTKIGEGARMNYSLAFVRNALTSNVGTSRSIIPADISVEADANSWLTFRGGLSHHIYDRGDNGTTAANTTARIGAGIHLGKADMDFTLAKDGTALPAFDESPSATNAQVFDISNGFFAQASVGYHW